MTAIITIAKISSTYLPTYLPKYGSKLGPEPIAIRGQSAENSGSSMVLANWQISATMRPYCIIKKESR